MKNRTSLSVKSLTKVREILKSNIYLNHLKVIYLKRKERGEKEKEGNF